MTPTPRCAAALALVAGAALVAPVGLTLLAALVVLVASVGDGLAVRRAPRLQRNVGDVLSRGVPARFSVRATTPDARRVLLRQPALPPALLIEADGSPGHLRGAVLPQRRGRHVLPGAASASQGPLGLARWHHPAGEATPLLVYPDLRAARRLVLRLRQGRAAPDGRLRRGPVGLGTEFEAVREYSPDDDVRQINWRATARLGRPMSNQYRVEQDRDLICLVDSGRLMGAPAGAGSLLDLALDAVTAVALVADELGDRCGTVAFDAGIRRSVDPGRRGGRRVVQALFDLQATALDSDFERAFLRVGAARRALVMVFTDLIDEAAARSLGHALPMLARRHALLVVSASDPDLEGALAQRPRAADDLYAMVVALSVLDARREAVTRLQRGGAEVIQAPGPRLPELCVQAYLRMKARARP